MTNKTIRAEVERISPLTDSILQLILRPEQYITYTAGQYLQIVLDDAVFSYSIANAPLGSQTYELHIRHSRENPYNQQLLESIRCNGFVDLRLPMGECHINKLTPDTPILFIAAGTGFAPIKAMIEHLLAAGSPQLFELYWGARSQSDLYMDEKVTHWHTHVPQFKYFSHLTASNQETLATVLLGQHQHDLKDWQFVLGGPFDMVYKLRDQLIEQGAKREQMCSDAFSFE